MKLKLKEILDNPFRDLATNPLLEEKLVELMSSINLTGFWENVVVRKNARGKYELAYGHHRLRAAIKAGVVEADFIVKDFSDAKMIQVMDSENRETYGSTPLALIETVEAIVEALENGSIPPFTIEKFARPDTVRYAPSFIPGEVGGNSPHLAYTAMNIANFLGRTESRGRVKGRPEDIRRKPEDAIVAALNFL
ncbi:MAG: ParB/RepB/Spo0J family partition protein, partial [Halobacteriota archaeon]